MPYTALNVTIKGTRQEAIDSLRVHGLLTPEVESALVQIVGSATGAQYTSVDLGNDKATEQRVVDWYSEPERATSLPPQMPFPPGTLIHYAYVNLEGVPDIAVYESTFEP
jgi:hypothetical protein